MGANWVGVLCARYVDLVVHPRPRQAMTRHKDYCAGTLAGKSHLLHHLKKKKERNCHRHSCWMTRKKLREAGRCCTCTVHPTTNGAVQNGSSVGIYTNCIHVSACWAPICMMSVLVEISASELIVGCLLRVRCWLGMHFCRRCEDF